MTFFRIARCMVLAFIVGLGSGCQTFNVTDRAVIKPVPEPVGAPTTAEAFKAMTSAPKVLRIERETGVSLHAVWLQQVGATHTVLYFGGNMSRINEGGPAFAKMLLPFGVNVLLVDHRGSGLSEGVPGIENMHADALATFDYLVNALGVDPATVIVQGHSLGSFLAGHVASKRKVAALVLSGSATTTEDWVKTLIPWYFKPFVRTRIAPEMQGRGNLEVVKNINFPLLIIVGEKDQQTAPSLSKALAKAAVDAGHSATLVVVPKATHDNAERSAQAQNAFAKLLEQLRAQNKEEEAR